MIARGASTVPENASVSVLFRTISIQTQPRSRIVSLCGTGNAIRNTTQLILVTSNIERNSRTAIRTNTPCVTYSWNSTIALCSTFQFAKDTTFGIRRATL